MAPIPKENRDRPPNDKDDGETGDFSNPNLMVPIDVAESSEDSDNEGEAVPNGYALLPQEPDECEDNSDCDIYDEEANSHSESESSLTQTGVGAATASGLNTVPEAVLSSEAGATTPTVAASQTSYHPEFLAKFPDGKIPSYMQVPSIPSDRGELLWNQSRRDASNRDRFDTAHESKILKAMSGFSLPNENIPDWAKTLPDDQWHQQVLSRIKKTDQSEPEEWTAQSSVDSESDTWTASFDDANKG